MDTVRVDDVHTVSAACDDNLPSEAQVHTDLAESFPDDDTSGWTLLGSDCGVVDVDADASFGYEGLQLVYENGDLYGAIVLDGNVWITLFSV